MANPLNILKKFFSGTGDKNMVIGVDIGSSSIKMVQLKRDKGKAVLQTYGAISLGPYHNEDLGRSVPIDETILVKAITDLSREAQITALDAVFSIPSSSSLVFLLELPGTIAESELATVVPTEARKYVPVPITEVSLDWWMLPRNSILEGNDDAGYSSASEKDDHTRYVLVAVIHNDMLAKFQNIVKESKLSVDLFEIEMFSNVRSCVAKDLSCLALVDIGATKTKVSIVERSVIQEFHIITRGSQDITSAVANSLGIPFKKAEELKKEFGLLANGEHAQVKTLLENSFEYISIELKQAILEFEKKRGKAVEKCVLTGGGSLLKGLAPHLSKHIGIPVELANPFLLTDTPAFIAPVLESVGPEFSVAVGLALRKIADN